MRKTLQIRNIDSKTNTYFLNQCAHFFLDILKKSYIFLEGGSNLFSEIEKIRKYNTNLNPLYGYSILYLYLNFDNFQ